MPLIQLAFLVALVFPFRASQGLGFECVACILFDCVSKLQQAI